jgi:hypothetical protein
MACDFSIPFTGDPAAVLMATPIQVSLMYPFLAIRSLAIIPLADKR